MIRASEAMKPGRRLLWSGPSFPFVPDRELPWPDRSAAVQFHYATHVLKVQTGRDVIHLPRMNQGEDGLFPLSWTGELEDGDRVLFNPNSTIFYNQLDPKGVKPARVLAFNVIHLEGPSDQQLTHLRALPPRTVALMVRSGTDSRVRWLSDLTVRESGQAEWLVGEWIAVQGEVHRLVQCSDRIR